MGVHNPKTHEDLQKLDETKLYHELDEKYNFIPATIPSYGQATFSHLMSGYNAGYYSYVWYVCMDRRDSPSGALKEMFD